MPTPSTQSLGKLPLKSQHRDKLFWAKLTALWHRERMRAIYEKTGVSSSEARLCANREALEVAHKHGFIGQLPELKAALSELIVNDLPGRGKPLPGSGIRYWEERVHRDMMRILAYPAPRLETELLGYLDGEVGQNGPFVGRTGFYKLTLIVGFLPTTDYLEKREAFLRVLHQIGHDPAYADREIYRVVLRLLQSYTHRPFETRIGEPMPVHGFKNGMRKMFGFLPFKSS
jgi:hypothetical protein